MTNQGDAHAGDVRDFLGRHWRLLLGLVVAIVGNGVVFAWTTATYAAKLEASLQRVDESLAEIGPQLANLTQTASDTEMKLQIMRAEIDELKGRVSINSTGLSSLPRIEEQLSSLQRQQDRLERLLDGR